MTVVAKKAPAKKPAAKSAPAKKPAAAKAPAFALPSFELPDTLMPDGAMELAEKSLESARDAFEKSSASVEEQGAAIEKSLDSATQSAKELNKKAIDAVKSNMDAGFGLLTDLMTVKSFEDAVALQTNFAGKQFEAFSAQSKDIQDALTKGFEETSAPVKAAAEKAMEAIKAA